jgi:hypothetical protein
MKQQSNWSGWSVPTRVVLAGPLALACSSGSILIAAVGGWQRGATTFDRAFFVVANVVAVLAAQFLPALRTHILPAKRRICLALWLFCCAYAALGHAWYLLAALERAGDSRADAVKLAYTSLPTASRDLSTILSDRAGVIGQLARLRAWTCEAACAERQRLRKFALEGRVAALDAEAQAATDQRLSRLRMEGEASQAKQDLIGSHLSYSLHVTYDSATWITALAYALMLEGLGCFCWAICLETKAETAALTVATEPRITIAEVTDAVTDHDADVTSVSALRLAGDEQESATQVSQEATDRDTSEPAVTRERDFSRDVMRVVEALRDSQIKLRVEQVRVFLGCGQHHARRVRKFIAETPGHASQPDS